jgi:hypothetical protein
MNSTELIDLYRKEMRDTEEPYLIDDAALYSYLDDAQKWFCRLTEGIEDSRTPEVTRLAVVPSTEWYSTSKLILKVREAHRLDNGLPIPIVNAEKASQLGILFDGKEGQIKYLIAGLDKNFLRAWPKPNETVDVELRVFRYPLAPITDAGDQELEIDEQHHRHLLLWVKHLAYDNHDVEMFDRRKSDDYKAKFEAYCFKAMKEQERARRSVGTVIYGGI